jgi:hypothetical protein
MSTLTPKDHAEAIALFRSEIVGALLEAVSAWHVAISRCHLTIACCH